MDTTQLLKGVLDLAVSYLAWWNLVIGVLNLLPGIPLDGGVSLLLGGLGFWWAWIDPDRLTWHDRLSGTRMLRQAR